MSVRDLNHCRRYCFLFRGPSRGDSYIHPVNIVTSVEEWSGTTVMSAFTNFIGNLSKDKSKIKAKMIAFHSFVFPVFFDFLVCT